MSRLVTKRDVIRGVPDRWHRQYKTRDGWNPVFDGSSSDVYEALLALDLDSCPADDVDRAIGNDSWTALGCEECRLSVAELVEFAVGDDLTAGICRDCLVTALAKFDAAPASGGSSHA